MLSLALLRAAMQQFSLNTIAVCITAGIKRIAAKPRFSDVALCKMANAESHLMKKVFCVVLHL